MYPWLYSPCGLWPLFQFLNLHRVGRTPWTGDEPIARPLPTHRTTQTQNKRTQTSMPRVGFEPRIPVLEWTKTVHALDRASTVIDKWKISLDRNKLLQRRLAKNIFKASQKMECRRSVERPRLRLGVRCRK
jgi:hypothetical protein